MTVPTGGVVPRIRPLVPYGWYVKESWTLWAPDRQANVIAAREPVDPTRTTAQYAATQGALLTKEFPHYTQHALVLVVTPQGPAPLRVFEWTPPDGVRVLQHQLYWTRDGFGFTMTATCPATVGSRYAALFHETLTRTSFSSSGPESNPWASFSSSDPEDSPESSPDDKSL